MTARAATADLVRRRLAGPAAALVLAAFAALTPADAGAQSRDAFTQARIGELEEEIRRLTGRLEEAEFRHRQLVDRIDRLIADLDRRFADAPPARSAPGAAATAPAVADAGSAQTASPSAPAPSATVASQPPIDARAGREDGVLGVLPADAVRGVETAQAPRALPGPGGDGLAATSAGDAQTRYDAALALLREGDWTTAEGAFADLVAAFPDDPLAPSAAYWVAETYFVRSDYAEAAAAFARNYRVYGSDAPKAADNLLKLSMSLSAVGDSEKACRALEQLDARHPDLSAAISQMARRERDRAGCA